MINIDKRIEFLADNYNIFMNEEVDNLMTELEEAGCEPTKVIAEHNTEFGIVESRLLAIIYRTVTNEDKSRISTHVKIHEDIFSDMLNADPTNNKMYLQWMLTIFTKLLKDGHKEDAIRFGAEDLPQANEYLALFDGNKRKRLFKDLCKTNYALKSIPDPTNINQYKSLSQLFDAIDPFIEREPSDLERAMNRFVEAGQAEIPVRDRNFTLFIPLTRDANVLFDKFAGWCTAKRDNGMFDSYTKQKTPISAKSKIYIIINNKFFTGESDELYQIHFESRQLRDRTNGPNRNIFDSVISKSEGLSNFFYEELMPMAKKFTGSIASNFYADYLIQFGFTDILFDMLDSNQQSLSFKDREIPKLPDLTRFQDMEILYMDNVSLSELPPSLFSLPKLGILALPKNKIRAIPREIGNCKTLTFINLFGNRISEIPEEIGQLDATRGGSLFMISVRKSEIGEENFKKLVRLLPSVSMITDEN